MAVREGRPEPLQDVNKSNKDKNYNSPTPTVKRNSFATEMESNRIGEDIFWQAISTSVLIFSAGLMERLFLALRVFLSTDQAGRKSERELHQRRIHQQRSMEIFEFMAFLQKWFITDEYLSHASPSLVTDRATSMQTFVAINLGII